ncbi:hypothetical protein MPSEU_000740800 [Mayamaea pseudoterrestris]|nr:hypothetical protein MPSEU_000740800 [Mayamaea pseudoterrestris]
MAPSNAANSNNRALTASKTIIIGLLLLFVVANLTQVIVIDLNSMQLPMALPSKLEFLNMNKQGSDSEQSRAVDKDASAHVVAGLTCSAHGGPASKAAVEEMVYWQDNPQDAAFVSPFKTQEEQYLTFEPDEGGWNNIRMAMETAVVFAVATGRTLVLPPQQTMYLLWNGKQKQHKKQFTFGDFFHFDSIAEEHANLKVIHFDEFLERVAMTGQLRNQTNGQVSFPPDNITDWTGGNNWESARAGKTKNLWTWFRNVVPKLDWQFSRCVAAFPAQRGNAGTDRMSKSLDELFRQEATEQPNVPENARWQKRLQSYNGRPTPVNASMELRMREIMADRRELCLYDSFWQNQKIIHLQGEEKQGGSNRMLVHFYAFYLFEDWKMDLWTKRFVRDHLRYLDEIQCASARVIEAVRQIARTVSKSNDGSYDSFHIRRGDFQYKEMHMSADEIYVNNSAKLLKEGRTVFVATDEKSTDYFKPLAQHYHLLFLNDFKQELGDLNPNYYGMVDQLVASRGQTFIGAYFSTFTGYINRMRGYHVQRKKAIGYEHGLLDSFYYTPDSDRWLKMKRNVMRSYHAIRQGFWTQEFPVAWRDIDFDVPTTKDG